MSENLGLSAPWVEYARELYVLFNADPDIRVEYDEEDVEVRLYVENPVKAEALNELLPTSKVFGNVELKIEIIPANSASRISLFRAAFDGNPIVNYIESVDEVFSNPMHFIVFKNEVVQYFNDDLTDINGVRSTLYQEIAKEVLGESEGIYFCTDIERDAEYAQPLGEWP